MRVVAAPDKFKGTVTAHEVAAAIGGACWELNVDCDEVPMADGGDGLLEILGGANRSTLVAGPLGKRLYALVDGRLPGYVGAHIVERPL